VKYTVSGNTFAHRDFLKSIGGRWDGAIKQWYFDYISLTNRNKIKALTGVFLHEPAPIVTFDPGEETPSPRPNTALENAVAALLAEKPTPERRRAGRTPSAMYGDDAMYHNHFADKNPAAFFGFSSLAAMTDYLEALPPGRRRSSGWKSDDGSWSGTSSMREALRMARDGWSEGVEMAEEALERLSLDKPLVKRRKPALAGGSVNVGRMLAGDPAHMVRRPKQPGRKVVTFFVECGFPGIITAETAVTRAVLIASMIDLMETVGYSCAVVAVDASLYRALPYYRLTVRLKESGERLNINDLIFALGHPAFSRRMSFATLASVPETEQIWESQGSPTDAFDEQHPCGKTEFYVPVLRRNCYGGDPVDLMPQVIPDKLPVEIKTHD
jgi:hypothetical protein